MYNLNKNYLKEINLSRIKRINYIKNLSKTGEKLNLFFFNNNKTKKEQHFNLINFISMLKIVDEFCQQNSIYYYISFFAYAIFTYKLIKYVKYLIEMRFVLNDHFTFSYKINLIILKIHFSLLYETKYPFLNWIVGLLFLSFKLKILFNILFLKYIGTLACIGSLSVQYKLYCSLIRNYYDVNTTFMATRDVLHVQYLIEREYCRFKYPAYILFFINFLECLFLVLTYFFK